MEKERDADLGRSGPPQAGPEEQPIRVDGYAQVLAMLQIADPEFRASLLARVAQRDPDLARSLRAELARRGV